MENTQNLSSEPKELSTASTNKKLSQTDNHLPKHKKNSKSDDLSLHGVPKHVEVITYITKARKNNLS